LAISNKTYLKEKQLDWRSLSRLET
jgi:hypothetical protein